MTKQDENNTSHPFLSKKETEEVPTSQKLLLDDKESTKKDVSHFDDHNQQEDGGAHKMEDDHTSSSLGDKDTVQKAVSENGQQQKPSKPETAKKTPTEEVLGVTSADGEANIGNGQAQMGAANLHEKQELSEGGILLKLGKASNADQQQQQQKKTQKLHRDLELTSIVRTMAVSTCNSHRDMLFGLFLHSSTSELELLSKESGVRLSAEANKGRKKRIREDRQKNSADLLAQQQQQGDQEEALPSERKKSRQSISIFPRKGKETLSCSPISLVPLALSAVVKSSGRKRDGTNSNNNPMVPPITDQGDVTLKRLDHENLTLRELEAKVLLKFESCSLGKKAISTENPQYSWFLTKSEIGKKTSVSALPLVPHQAKKKFSTMSLVYNECSMIAFASWASSPAETAASKAASSISSVEYVFPTIVSTAVECPIPATTSLFRCCQVCRKWGHQEIECERLDQPDMLSEIASEITTLSASNHQDEAMLDATDDQQRQSYSAESIEKSVASTSCTICKLNVHLAEESQSLLVCGECRCRFHSHCVDPPIETPVDGIWLCTACDTNEREEGFDSAVEVEGCEGFVIEQRKLPMIDPAADSNHTHHGTLSKSMGIDFGERSWSRAVCVANTKALISVSGKPVEPAVVQRQPSQEEQSVLAADDAATAAKQQADKRHDFSEGEFCWAKREHAERGRIARDEWWPAQVLATISCPRSVKYFSTDVTPYLVKFFGIARASRVRASSAIPFFQNFRTVGYKRLTARKPRETPTDRGFRRGVEEAISLMGFKSMTQLLARADEIVQMEQPKAAIPRVPPQRRFMAKKLKAGGFKTFKQDGFVIYARESGKRPASTMMMDTRLQDRADTPPVEVKGPVQVFSRTKLAGCLVAWMSRTAESKTALLKVGTVLVADVHKKVALVSPIPDWEEKLKPPSSKTGVVVRNYQACTAEWMSMDKLHMLCNGPGKDCHEAVSKDVISGLLSSARDLAATELRKAAAAKKVHPPPSDEEEEAPRVAIARPIDVILNERNSHSGREYQVKWKDVVPGTPMSILPSPSKTSWVPEQTITNPNLVLKYQIEKLLSALSPTAQMKVKSSATYRVCEALRSGMEVIDANFEGPVAECGNVHVCPFCELKLDGMHVFAEHMKEHKESPNYGIIREAARLARADWY